MRTPGGGFSPVIELPELAGIDIQSYTQQLEKT
jgi:hypothetical protein